ncbi:RidA family protein [Phenylobacterium sp. LjRoot219]|uniref:RidA family protein n=1 Tax=Phenylobacterium sp. LjRoot219 TaxID=3342283 RepID=UPI003ECD4409
MSKPFEVIVPASMKAVSDAYRFSPAVRISDLLHISGIIGVDAHGRLLPTFAARRRISSRRSTMSQASPAFMPATWRAS